MFGKNLQLNAISFFQILIIMLIIIPLPAQADTHTWTGSASDLWSNYRNWSPGSVPGAGDTVIIEDSDNLPVQFNGGAFPLNILTINNSGQVELSDGYSLVTVDEYIGYNSEGSFTQNGGTHQILGQLDLGCVETITKTWYFSVYRETVITSGGSGTYTLNDGTLLVMGDENIGVNGTGIFTQNGGTHVVNGDIILAQNGGSASWSEQEIDGTTFDVRTVISSSSGTYKLNDGLLQANQISGGDGDSKLVINGGTLNVLTENITVDNLIFGDSAGSDVSYTQSFGTVTVDTEIIGNDGKGTYIQTGGTHTAQTLKVGSESAYQLSGSSVLNTNEVYIHGTFDQLEGTHNTHGITLSAASSVYNMEGGTINGSSLEINSGIFNQNGGTQKINYLELAGAAGGRVGTYNLTDGLLTVTGTELIGYDGDSTGVFNQSGGTHTAGTLQIGYGHNNSGTEVGEGGGTYTLTDGELTVGSETIGVYGSGTFIQEGGTHVIENDLTFGYAGFLLYGEGTYMLNGGTLSVDSIITASYGKLSINGGSLTVDTGNISLTEFYLGEKADTSGSYTQSIGTITAKTETIGKYGTGDFTQNGGTHTVTDVLSLGRRAGSVGTYTLNDGDLTVENRELVGFYGTGTFNQTGGTHTVESTLFLGYGASGQGTYILDDGELNAGQEEIGRNGIGTFTQNGGTNTVTGALTIGTQGRYTQTGGILDTGGITNSGQFTSSGGTLTVGTSGIQNTGDMNLGSSNNQIGGSVSNSGTMKIAGTTALTGNVTNSGSFKVENTTVTVNGTYTENCSFTSDSSTSTIDTLVVNSTGYLKGGLTDEWIINQSFENLSLENLEWDTGDSTLTFSGDTAHEMVLAGADFGADMDGYLNNFAWGSLNIEGTLTLFDGNSTEGGALYVNILTGLSIIDGIITNILFGDSGTDYLNIYYLSDLEENDYLGGLTYALANGGNLISISATAAVPIPGSLFLLLSGMLVLLKIRRGSVQLQIKT